MGEEKRIALPTQAAGYHPFIDGLRAVAVLGVLCFHFGLAGIGGGYAGVDVFFVLSGYLITQLIDARLRAADFSFAHFYARRARRILPALFVTCALSTAAAALLLVPHDFREFAKSLKATAFFYSNAVFAQSDAYFAAAVATRPLLHTWSLAVEEQFYLLWPPLLYLLYKASPAQGRRQAGVAVLLAVSLLFSVWLLRADPEQAFYLLPPRAWELLTGAMLALLPAQPRWTRMGAETLSLLGASGIGASFVLYNRATVFPGVAALLPCLGTALLLTANLRYETWVGRLLSHRVAVYIGLISYGLYLYHWPILTFMRYYLDHPLSGSDTAAAICATVGLATASFHWLESPLRTGASSRRRVFAISAAGLLCLGAIGIMGVNADGFPQRFSGAALAYARGGRDQWPWEACMPPISRMNADTVCKFGLASAPASFLVWGDSHAAALAPAIDARAKSLGIAGWVIGYSRCPALLDAAPRRRTADDHPCAAIAAQVLRLIAAHGIHHVLLASRWDAYIAGWERGGTETMQDLTLEYQTAAGELLGPAAFRQALADTLRRLRALDLDIWVLEEVPPQLIDVPSALAKGVYFGRDLASLRRPFAAIESRRAAAQAVFQEYAGARDISFIDPAATFCPKHGACLIAAQGRALYADGNHLSVFGALWARSMLDPFFNAIVRSASRP